MDQDATWYGGRPRLRPHCAKWGPTSPPQNGGTALQFSAHVCCGQTAGWIKVPLGTKIQCRPRLRPHCVTTYMGTQLPQKGCSLTIAYFSSAIEVKLWCL